MGAYLVYKNVKAVDMDGNIHYYRPANKGEILTATAHERKSGKKTGIYFVELRNQDDKLNADGLFTAMYLDRICLNYGMGSEYFFWNVQVPYYTFSFFDDKI